MPRKKLYAEEGVAALSIRLPTTIHARVEKHAQENRLAGPESPGDSRSRASDKSETTIRLMLRPLALACFRMADKTLGGMDTWN